MALSLSFACRGSWDETSHALESERGLSAAHLLTELQQAESPDYAHLVSERLGVPPELQAAQDEGRIEAYFRENARQPLEMNPSLLNAASEATVGQTWTFRSPEVKAFFEGLFRRIEAAQTPKIDLTAHDLFHGHLFLADGELGILFHAMEYPHDLFESSPASFTTADPEYRYRNLIWLLSSDRIWALDAGPGSLLAEQLIYPEWIRHSPRENWEIEVKGQFEKARTLQEKDFHDLGQNLGSLNFFTEAEAKRLDPKRKTKGNLLFLATPSR